MAPDTADREHVLYVDGMPERAVIGARVLRLADFSTTKDLIETDSRVQYSPSTVTPGTGYLLYVRAGNLLAHLFDPRSLRVTGEAMPVASRVYSFPKPARRISRFHNGPSLTRVCQPIAARLGGPGGTPSLPRSVRRM